MFSLSDILLEREKRKTQGSTGQAGSPQCPARARSRFLENMFRHMEDKEVTGESQHGLTEGRACLTHLVTCDKVVTELRAPCRA